MEGNLGSLGPSSSQNTYPVVNKGGLLRGTVGSLVYSQLFSTKTNEILQRGGIPREPRFPCGCKKMTRTH